MKRNLIFTGSLFWLMCLAVTCAAQLPASSAGGQVSIRSVQNTPGAEKIYLHTDKTVYLTGEILWFAAYNVDAHTHLPALISKIAYVELISSDSRPVAQAKIALTTGTGEGSMLLPLSLNSGNYRLRAYTQWMRNRPAERFFETELVVINPLKLQPADSAAATVAHGTPPSVSGHQSEATTTLAIGTTSDREAYETRSEVSVSVSLPGKSTASASRARLSLSVFRIDSLQPSPATDISSVMNSSGESPGLNDAEQGTARFAPEFAGHLVQGKVTRKNDGSPASNILVYVSAQGKPFRFAGASTDSAGIFRVDLPGFFGFQELVVQTENQKDSGFRTQVFSPFDENISAKPVADWQLRPGQQEDLRFHSLAAQVQDAFSLEEMNRFTERQYRDSTPFYGKPDQEFLLDDYTRFNSMEEVMREFVSGLTVKKIRRGFHFRVMDLPRKEFFSEDPLMLLDGMPVFEGDRIMALDPLKIRKIDVVTRRWYLGSVQSEGILSLSSYNGYIEGMDYDSNSLVLDYEGLQQKRNFYSPRYRATDPVSARIPDFRTVLFWKPDLIVQPGSSESVHFYTSDRKGRYMVRVEGMDERGNTGSSYFTFEVR